MKTILTLLLVSLVSFPLQQLKAQETSLSGSEYAEIRSQVILPYCEALKNGDVDALKQFMSEDMYNEKKVLLEQNTTYPEFLRDLYSGAVFQLKRETVQDGKIIVYVIIEFPDGRQRNLTLSLQKDPDEPQETDAAGLWKVSEIIP